LLSRLRTASAALRDSGDDLAADLGWDLADAALIAQSVADLTTHLPSSSPTLKQRSITQGHLEVEGYSKRCTPPMNWWLRPTAWP